MSICVSRKDFHLVLFLQQLVWIQSNMAAGPRHASDVIQKPEDVIGSACGENIEMQCMAKAIDQETARTTAPDIEWWYRGADADTLSAEKLTELHENGKITIRNEVFLVVRSTLVIHDTKLSDQGVYQCRASASPAKHDDGINVYQHWKIEEAPVKDLQCGRASTPFAQTFGSAPGSTTFRQTKPETANDVIRQPVQTEIDELRKSTLTSIMTTAKRYFTNQTIVGKTTKISHQIGQRLEQKDTTTPPSGGASIPGLSSVVFWILQTVLFYTFV